MQFFITCPKGIESLLFDELHSFGIETLKQTVAGVAAECSLQQAYTVMMWSRLANQLLLQLGDFKVNNQQELYDAVATVPWHSHFSVSSSFAIKFSGTNRELKNSQFSALKVKDAVVDSFRKKSGQRPNVDSKNPDIMIQARLHRDQLQLSLDIAAGSLHRRRYREQAGRAPLKENLAAAVLIRAGWQPPYESPLIDPLCGTGTLVIEAALMQADIAPGLLRDQQLNGWIGHDNKLFKEILQQARTRRSAGLEKAATLPRLVGFDQHWMSLSKAQQSAKAAGIEGRVHFQQQELKQLLKPGKQHSGFLIANLPYGQRLSNELDLMMLNDNLSELAHKFEGWTMSLLAGAEQDLSSIPYRWDKNYRLYNGALEVVLYNFILEEGQKKHGAIDNSWQDIANRLRKNQKRLKNFINKLDSNCYRIYDADIPEYAVAVDVYADYIQLTEYKAPATIDEKKAAARLQQAVRACLEVFEISTDKLILKQRLKQKGKQQYEKRHNRRKFIEVEEGQARLLVNLWDYLDTGLFLDHRPVRRFIAEHANGKHFLNLFCYTATASVHAALAGAKSTTSVDLSKTYLNWAKDNFELNNIKGKTHHFVRSDIVQWLEQELQTDRKYHLILLDPPSFSNSKSTENNFDVQRDHSPLIESVMELLSENGTLIFSNNRRGFKLDDGIKSAYQVEDFHRQSLDADFERNKNIHCCYLIRHR